MQEPATFTLTLRYPDGWQETWFPRKGATRESLISIALELLEEAGVDFKVMLDMGHTGGEEVPEEAITNHTVDQGEGDSDEEISYQPGPEASTDVMEKEKVPEKEAQDSESETDQEQ